MPTKNKKPIELVKKPTLEGSYHGKDAYRLAGKRTLSMVFIAIAYLMLGLMGALDSDVLRILISVGVVVVLFFYQYSAGVSQGETDSAYGEIMYARKQEGKTVTPIDHDKCYHPLKGYFATVVGMAPYMLLAIVFAFMAKLPTYSLGVLPAWTESYMLHGEMADSLAYYQHSMHIQTVDVLRILVRCMIMPFINIASCLGSVAVLWVERFSALLLLIAPLGYGVGYRNGLVARMKINTGIKIGVAKKRKKARKEKMARQKKSPERLI